MMTRVVALSGGVGGAKLALGLSDLVKGESLAIISNTADDFEHLGLLICPDIDTQLYTLSGKANSDQGWGLADESWRVMDALEALGGETWFRLGDMDLATHLWRRGTMDSGATLTEATRGLRRALNIQCDVLPMSNDPVRTIIQCEEGDLSFQHYFVRRRCEPAVRGVVFAGADCARPSDEALAALASPELEAIIICPSNPFVSIDPILHVGAYRRCFASSPAPVIAVSPIVGGRAIKGPAAKMMAELGFPVSPVTIARRYSDFIDCLVIDEADAESAPAVRALGVEAAVTRTVMTSRDDKRRLAQFVMDLAKGGDE